MQSAQIAATAWRSLPYGRLQRTRCGRDGFPLTLAACPRPLAYCAAGSCRRQVVPQRQGELDSAGSISTAAGSP